jgi:DNA modification methylase
MIIHGDCVAEMAKMPEASVDAVVCDPPYGLEFMGKEWDALRTRATREVTPFDPQGPAFAKGMKLTGAGNPTDRIPSPQYDRKRMPKCRKCGKWRYNGWKPRECSCPDPEWVTDTSTYPRQMQEWHESWAREALRVLKPGGHLLAFGGTRTYHRLACAIEDAGFEIRDCLSWMYGSGFPKSLDVSKAIDKAAQCPACLGKGYTRPFIGTGNPETRPCDRCNGTGRATRAVVGPKWPDRYPNGPGGNGFHGGVGREPDASRNEPEMATAPATPEAQQWQGWGTALKPAHEPIVMARKPLAGTVAANCLEFGTGALNVDGCRIGYASEADKRLETRGVHVGGAYKHPAGDSFKKAENAVAPVNPAGRWPANVVLSHDSRCEQVGTRRVKSGTAGADARGFRTEYVGGEAKDAGLPAASYADADGLETVAAWRCVESCPVRLLDEQSGERPAGEPRLNRRGITTGTSIGGQGRYGTSEPHEAITGYGDSGGASRFFYTAKASSAERNAGLEGFEAKPVPVSVIQTQDRTSAGDELGGKQQSRQRNVHPTVKPITLMRWLVRLVTPPSGTVLDPFCGSGTTGIAAGLEGLNFVGIEREEEYVRIAEARIRWWSEHPEGVELSKGLEADRRRRAVADSGQLGFLDDV